MRLNCPLPRRVKSDVERKIKSNQHICENCRLHDLVLSNAGWFVTHVPSLAWARRMDISDECDSQRTATVLVTGEFGYRNWSAYFFLITINNKRSSLLYLQIAVSAVSGLSNSTTPVPRERPLPSYWISARSTLPIVVNRSTKSSLQVDQGS